MNAQAPVFTEPTRCQDCYKCVRECPAKAIRVADGCAQVQAAECVACGHCVAVCPAGAKRVRDDLPAVRALLAGPRPVVVSLAPSWVAAWPGLELGRLIAACRRLGFANVSETAHGAREVSATIAARPATGLRLSSACPAAVDFLKKRHPHLGGCVTDLLSPLLAHAHLIRQALPGAAVVFIGPCVAKKREAEAFPDLLDACLTFADLDAWLAAEAIDPAALAPADEPLLGRAAAGTLYPVEGGMLAGIRHDCGIAESDLVAVSGLDRLADDLAGLSTDRPLFVEMLACRGGCIGGPGLERADGLVARRRIVVAAGREDGVHAPALPIATAWRIPALPLAQPDATALRAALARLGKRTTHDELNCGGCGYESCRELAAAVATGRAEPAMCVSHMRRLAQGTAEGWLKAMPAAALLVDGELRVVAANALGAALVGVAPAEVVGAPIARLPPLERRLRQLLAGAPAEEADLRLGAAVYRSTIFAVEAGQLVGAVLSDVTAPALRRAEVVRRARSVVDRHLETVQRIACLLGENAAETEAVLDTIADAFDDPR